MRHVLRNSDEAIHFWANRVQSSGRAASVFFADSKLYSYGKHFCIARHLPSGTVVMTTRSYSTTTARHISKARSAVSHLVRVYCNDPDRNAWENRHAAESELLAVLANAAKPRIRQITRDGLNARAYDIAANFNMYLSELPADEKTMATRGAPEPFDLTTLSSYREVAEAAKVEQAKRRAEEARETLAKWRTREVIDATRLLHLPPALRLSEDGESIQTSHGARIPTSQAERLWVAVQCVRHSEREWEGSQRLGDYTLSRIRTDGSIVVGCHDIPAYELAYMARELGLLSAV